MWFSSNWLLSHNSQNGRLFATLAGPKFGEHPHHFGCQNAQILAAKGAKVDFYVAGFNPIEN